MAFLLGKLMNLTITARRFSPHPTASLKFNLVVPYPASDQIDHRQDRKIGNISDEI
jgi:hypothetical protein